MPATPEIAPDHAGPDRPIKTKKMSVSVSYAGLTKTITANPNQAVQVLLAHALNEFQVHNNRHTLSLFTVAGAELADAQSLEAAGINDDDELLLRPSQVKGGAHVRSATS